ncbi:MAG: c-type cytochrome [Acidobacteria bacterium]|nr:c-type cytochrome [Acidobacteriota bacterium]
MNGIRKVGGVLLVVLGLAMGSSLLQAQSVPGESTFKANCVLCHGVDGKANTPLAKQLNAPDLTSPKVQSQPDALLKQIISEGKNNMPSFKGQLQPDEITQVLSYIRKLGKAKKAGSGK